MKKLNILSRMNEYVSKRNSKDLVQQSGFQLKDAPNIKIADLAPHRQADLQTFWSYFLVELNRLNKDNQQKSFKTIIEQVSHELENKLTFTETMELIILENCKYHSNKEPFTEIQFTQPKLKKRELSFQIKTKEKVRITQPTVPEPKPKLNYYQKDRQNHPEMYALESKFGKLKQRNETKCVFIDSERKVVTHLVSEEYHRFDGYKSLEDAQTLISELSKFTTEDPPFPKIIERDIKSMEVDGKKYLLYKEQLAKGKRLAIHLNSGNPIRGFKEIHLNEAIDQLRKLHIMLDRAHGDLKTENIFLNLKYNENGNLNIDVTYIDLASPNNNGIRTQKRMDQEIERITVLFSRLIEK